MSARRLPEVVMSARRGRLERARGVLAHHGIACHASRPRRSEGFLRVADADAARARELLRAALGGEGLVQASEAAWLRCFECREPLSLGAKHCAHCGALVGDGHGS